MPYYQCIHTPYGQGIEFDCARVTKLVINLFGLEDTGGKCRINIRASIDAGWITKNLCHTSASLKIRGIEGCVPLKYMRSFLTDGNSIRDLRSHNEVLPIIITHTKETKESLRQFNDIFQFFHLSELTTKEKQNCATNSGKFRWEHLSGLKQLPVMFTTDIAVNWKNVGARGGVKNTKIFCTLCACTSSDAHQPKDTTCD